MFCTSSVKFVTVLQKIEFLKNPRWRTCCETTVAMGTVLN